MCYKTSSRPTLKVLYQLKISIGFESKTYRVVPVDHRSLTFGTMKDLITQEKGTSKNNRFINLCRFLTFQIHEAP